MSKACVSSFLNWTFIGTFALVSVLALARSAEAEGKGVGVVSTGVVELASYSDEDLVDLAKVQACKKAEIEGTRICREHEASFGLGKLNCLITKETQPRFSDVGFKSGQAVATLVCAKYYYCDCVEISELERAKSPRGRLSRN